MRKLMFSKLLSGAMVIAGFALLNFAGRHVFATPNATGGADNQTKDRASKPSISAVSLEKSVVFQLEGEPEDGAYWDMGEPSAKIVAGANANAVLSLDLIADGGPGNQRDDGVTTGTVSGQGTTIAIEVFATGVRTSLIGFEIKFDFDASLLAFRTAQASAFSKLGGNSTSASFGGLSYATLAPSGFLARAEFETVADVTGREFSIGIVRVSMVGGTSFSDLVNDTLTTTSAIRFNATPSPDFDGDGTVGFSDFLAFASKFGTQRGDAAFDAQFDLNGDGGIGFADLLIFAENFGKEVPSDDRAALVALYEATDGPNWTNKENWLSAAPLGEWYGVTTDSNGRVTRLSLNENNLQGTIPAELARLTRLTYLSLGWNQLTGAIPTELARLTKLSELNLYVNQLTGTIPTELAQLTRLTDLELGFNQLTGAIPTELARLSKLTRLGLSTNQLTGAIPTELARLTRLTWLELQQNQLTGAIPTELARLSKLTWLELGSNQLTGEIPTELGQLANLTDLWLYNNQLTGEIPTELGQLANLTDLWLNVNQLTGRIPTELGQLTNLTDLWLNGNQLSGTLPQSLTRLTKLETFYFGGEGGLCAPLNAAFQTWLQGIKDASGPNCSGTSPPSGSPDLIVESPSVDDNTLTTGQSFTLSVTVRNQGTEQAAATTLRYYRSADATISTDDTEVGTDGVSGLSAGETSAKSISLNAPSDAGTYYYGACVESVSGESDAGNNCSVAVTVTVGTPPAPDLVVDAPTVSNSSPTAGASFTLSATVRNQGNGQSTATTLRYYRSTNATITTQDTQVGTDAVGVLAASRTSAESIGLTAPSSVGTYYYGACVESVSGETDTGNNCSPAVTVTVGAAPAPDLVVDSPSVSNSSPTAGVSFTLSATVRNQGSGTAAATTLRWYRSTDATISTQDTQVGTDAVGVLAAPGTSAESISLNAPSDAGIFYYGACVDAVSGESDSKNNCSAAVTVTVGAPDLVVDAPTVSNSSPTAGASFTLNATVRNQGNGQSAATTLRYYRSTNATITTQDTQVGTDAVGVLAASRTSAESIGLTAPSSVGTYYYGACVESVSGETDTGNNCSPAVTVTVGAAPAPDLVVDAPSVSNSSPTAGDPFTLNATVRNQGNGQAAATTLRYYRSTDATITTQDTQVGTDAVGVLAAPGTSDHSSDLTAPSSVGTYYYGACVESVSGESDTGNNCSPAVTVTVGAAPAPDLVVDAPTVSTSSPTAGASFTLSATVRNQGNGQSAAATTLRYYRSTDATITTQDTQVGTDVVGVLAAPGTSAESISLNAPSDAGIFYYGACVDAVSGESDSENNCSAAVTVTVGAPDLVVDAPTVSNSSPPAGASFTLSATVRNQGTGRSGSTTLRYYLSTDATVSASDTEVGADLVSTLSASRTSSESITLTAPASAGTYYYGACVESVSGESDTGNNCSPAVTVTVGAPDLVVDAPTVSNSSPPAEASFWLWARVRNQGNGQSAATTLRYYRSTNATITTQDTQVGTDAVGVLAASRTSAESISLTAPSSVGTYYYGACVESVSGETDTGNNCSAAVTVTVATVTPPATGTLKLYWTDWGTDKIQRADLDGSNVEDLISGAGLNGPDGLSLDLAGGKLYWADSGTNKIQRANLDGSGIEDLATDQNLPFGLALDVSGGKMYWTNRYPGKIQRANLDGSGVEELVTTSVALPGALALDVAGGKIYWTSVVLGGQNKIQRADLNGSNVEDLVTSGLIGPFGLALDVAGGKIYWTDRGTDKIQRADLNGSNVEDLVTSGLSSPNGIALDLAGGKIYWADAETDKVQRANLDGTDVEDLLTRSDGLVDPSSIALGAEAVSGSN